MSRRREKRRHGLQYVDVELNIMPFIDVFSMLNTFLLFSAAFLTIGIIEVQVPFLSNAPPPTDKTRFLNINVDVEKQKLEVVSTYSSPPSEEKKWPFDMTPAGLGEAHKKLAELRRDNTDVDKVTLFSEDDVLYGQITDVLDAIKSRIDADPVVVSKSASTLDQELAKQFLFPKVVMGSVLLP